ncbi:RDD family protein [Streptomyces zhihengii]|uniref:RDD family protein n=2 Tax=Streptomyces zhihengii TaxID=1818004 RepID=A0ABS2UUU0_9ACTN|nr:RDD family protein [Streptomyces zhihengii]MBM9621337.1 RDD family protein [Streptomyces zhihengii]
MSAPTPATGDSSPTPGYYPDPSIPGYVRYWNGGAWVPGTSRPAPTSGEEIPVPPPSDDALPAQGPVTPPAPAVEETGPVFLDEEEPAGQGPARPAAAAPWQSEPARSEPASAWQADAARQTGFGGDLDSRVSWGGAPGPAADGAAPDPRRPAEPAARAPEDPSGGMLPGMRSVPPGTPAAPADPAPAAPAADAPALPAGAEGTVAIRALRPGGAAAGAPEHTVAIRPQRPGATGPGAGEGTMTIRSLGGAPAPAQPSPAVPAQPAQPQPPATAQPQSALPGATAPARPAPAQQPPAQQSAPAAGQQAAPGASPAAGSPLTSGPGGGAASWPQQVHRLAPSGPAAGGDQPVVPWKPPVDDPFLRAAQAQANARPAPLGKRLAARLLDTLLLGALVSAVAVPVGMSAFEHIDAKIEAAKLSGRTVTVWLVDGTTAGQIGIVLGALLVLGVLYEALPTARWGRTLGKKLCGVRVMGIESHEPPSFGAALRRWLLYSVLGLLVIGLLNVLWCLFDRPWRQCWHDKAAGTFVSG